MFTTNDYKYYLYIVLLLICILIIILIVKAIYNNVKDKEAEDEVNAHLDEINYLERLDECLFNLFGTNEIKRSLRQSNQVVSNFSTFMQLRYLCKYFGLVINDENINYLYELKDLINELLDIDSDNKRVPEKVGEYIPCMSMYYISPQGRSWQRYDLYLFPDKIDELIDQVKVANKRQAAPQYQRGLVTKQMRESILTRDNWTCQRCGNSVYNEPNLLLEVDHIIPVSRGGKTEPNNLQTLCWKCNREKSDCIDYMQ